MKFSALLLIVLISFSSCDSFVDKLKCIFENEKVKKSVINLLKAINAGEQPVILLSKAYIAFTEIKKAYGVCWVDEPALKGGCRFEEQFKNCLENSCEYMDENECYEYCGRKYC